MISWSNQTVVELPDNLRKVFTYFFLGALFLLGMAHWVWYLNGGDIPWDMIDWPKEHAYCQVFRSAFREHTIPYHMSAEYQDTDRFLGNPEINLSPQVALLAFVEPGSFVLLNTLILYSAGFIGCLLIRARYKLGPVAFIVLWLLFNFNGHITDHLSASHPMWTGYFLLPFYLLWLLQWAEDGPSSPLTAKLALVIFAILLQGSFHLAVWCWMFFGLFVIFNPKCWKEGLTVFGLSGLLSACRILPAVITFWNTKGHVVLPGYTDLGQLFEAFCVLHDASKPLFKIEAGVPIFFWEYDMYIGLTGLIGVVWFGIVSRWLSTGPVEVPVDPQASVEPRTGSEREAATPNRWRGYSTWDAPMVLMSLLSVGPYFGWLSRLPIPLVSSERVPSRFLLLPALLLIVIAVIRMNEMLRKATRSALYFVLVAGGLAELTSSLLRHSIAWQITRYPDWLRKIGFLPRAQAVIGIANRPDPLYVASIWVGLAITAATAAAWIYCTWFRRREENPQGVVTD